MISFSGRIVKLISPVMSIAGKDQKGLAVDH